MLNQMNYENIAEAKFGEEDRNFPHLYNMSWKYLGNQLKRDFLRSKAELNLKFLRKYFWIR